MSEQRCGAIWSDPAPTQPGWYWVKGHASGEMWPTRLHDDGSLECSWTMVDFGPRIPSPEELHDLNRLAAVARYALESWGMTLEEWEATQGKDQVTQ